MLHNFFAPVHLPKGFPRFARQSIPALSVNRKAKLLTPWISPPCGRRNPAHPRAQIFALARDNPNHALTANRKTKRFRAFSFLFPSAYANEFATRLGIKKAICFRKSLFCLVGMTGFEPATPSSRTKYATGLRYIPNWTAKIKQSCRKNLVRNGVFSGGRLGLEYRGSRRYPGEISYGFRSLPKLHPAIRSFRTRLKTLQSERLSRSLTFVLLLSRKIETNKITIP